MNDMNNDFNQMGGDVNMNQTDGLDGFDNVNINL